MKKWKVSAWPGGGKRMETVIVANDFIAARKMAASMFGCKENEIRIVEVKT